MKKRLVLWESDARTDMKNISNYIAERNPEAALKVINKIENAGQNLGRFAAGHHGRVQGTYEMGVSNLPYAIAYMIYAPANAEEEIVILRIIHNARDWRENEWPE